MLNGARPQKAAAVVSHTFFAVSNRRRWRCCRNKIPMFFLFFFLLGLFRFPKYIPTNRSPWYGKTTREFCFALFSLDFPRVRAAYRGLYESQPLHSRNTLTYKSLRASRSVDFADKSCIKENHSFEWYVVPKKYLCGICVSIIRRSGVKPKDSVFITHKACNRFNFLYR